MPIGMEAITGQVEPNVSDQDFSVENPIWEISPRGNLRVWGDLHDS